MSTINNKDTPTQCNNKNSKSDYGISETESLSKKISLPENINCMSVFDTTIESFSTSSTKTPKTSSTVDGSLGTDQASTSDITFSNTLLPVCESCNNPGNKGSLRKVESFLLCEKCLPLYQLEPTRRQRTKSNNDPFASKLISNGDLTSSARKPKPNMDKGTNSNKKKTLERTKRTTIKDQFWEGRVFRIELKNVMYEGTVISKRNYMAKFRLEKDIIINELKQKTVVGEAWVEMNSKQIKWDSDHDSTELNLENLQPKMRVMVLDKTNVWCEALVKNIDSTKVNLTYISSHTNLRYETVYKEEACKRIKIVSDETNYVGFISNQQSIEASYKRKSRSKNKKQTKKEKCSALSKTTKTIDEKQVEFINDSNIEEELKFRTKDQQLVEGHSKTWFIYCNSCKIVIHQYRYFCMYCEKYSEGYDYESFELCEYCFKHKFPKDHEHPKLSFSRQSLLDRHSITEYYPSAQKKDIYNIIIYQEDILLDSIRNYEFPMSSKTCAFCFDMENESLELGNKTYNSGDFVQRVPFILETSKTLKTIHASDLIDNIEVFWCHYNCAKYSPSVLCVDFGSKTKWYNITKELKESQEKKCYVCKHQGATIHCSDNKCSYVCHLKCSGKPLNHFEAGILFYCAEHELKYLRKDRYEDVFSCDMCQTPLNFLKNEASLELNSWFTCRTCFNAQYYSSYDLCVNCYESNKEGLGHVHSDSFILADYNKMVEMEYEKLTNWIERPKQKLKNSNNSSVLCIGCFVELPSSKGSKLCNLCLESESLVSLDYRGSYAEYKHYKTRESSCALERKYEDTFLTSYEPLKSHWFSLKANSTYYDIPGRAPRWATHSGVDYHGTWLPQTVRRALQIYTKEKDTVLSTFLGRGTDAIECLLMRRKCIGVDINPSAIVLSMKNCDFNIPKKLNIDESLRPTIRLADSRNLNFIEDGTIDHVLSHPPYKNCVEYSLDIEGDLSKYVKMEDFQGEMSKVISEAYRVLKNNGRVTLGIGDNREQCFYIPLGFDLIETFMRHNFEVEEIIIKRQRQCQMFGLGSYLCVQHDFLVFTHEFIITFKKEEASEDISKSLRNYLKEITKKPSDVKRYRHLINIKATKRIVPICLIERKSVVLGSVWSFNTHTGTPYINLIESRIVERFGRNNSVWEELIINILKNEEKSPNITFPQKETCEPQKKNKDDEPEFSLYENERKKKIAQNLKTMLNMGLDIDLNDENCDDLQNYQKMMDPMHQIADINTTSSELPTSLILIPHIPNYQLTPKSVPYYRKSIIEAIVSSIERLSISGFMVVGVQDYRVKKTRTLLPLSVYVHSDIREQFKCLKLKEVVVCVPNGYKLDRDAISSEDMPVEIHYEDPNFEYLDIVHSYYLVWMKLD